jgi:hypothetical protein
LLGSKAVRRLSSPDQFFLEPILIRSFLLSTNPEPLFFRTNPDPPVGGEGSPYSQGDSSLLVECCYWFLHNHNDHHVIVRQLLSLRIWCRPEVKAILPTVKIILPAVKPILPTAKIILPTGKTILPTAKPFYQP